MFIGRKMHYRYINYAAESLHSNNYFHTERKKKRITINRWLIYFCVLLLFPVNDLACTAVFFLLFLIFTVCIMYDAMREIKNLILCMGPLGIDYEIKYTIKTASCHLNISNRCYQYPLWRSYQGLLLKVNKRVLYTLWK
jgi:hypothetical protein